MKDSKADKTEKPLHPTDSIRVVRATLHQSIDLPQQGGVATSLYEGKGVSMWYHSSGLYCTFKNKRFIVPLANVVYVWETLND
jgi:hypothetical protein